MESPDRSIRSYIWPTAKVVLLAAMLFAWLVLATYSLFLQLLPRHTNRNSTPRDLTIIAPFQPGNESGGAQAIAGLLTALARRFNVSLIDLSANTAPRDWKWKLAYLLTLAIPIPDHCRRLLVSAHLLRQELHHVDRVLIEFSGSMLFLVLTRRPSYRVILRDHEVLLRKLAIDLHSARGLAKLQDFLSIAICYIIGIAMYSRADAVITLTDEDRDYLERWYPFLRSRTETVRVHFECPEAPPQAPILPAMRELLFLGNFYHKPNVDGLLWFLQEVAPSLAPGHTLHLCGIDKPLNAIDLKSAYIQVVRHGFVDDVESKFRDVGLAVAPIVSGGGVRIKNLHLACLGKAIVTTPLGNEGIGFVHGHQALISTCGVEMANQINTFAQSPTRMQQMGLAARKFVRQVFDIEAVGDQLEKIIRG